MFSREYSGYPHRRWHALKGSWVLVSPHRTARPWSGAVEKAAGEDRPAYDLGCYLCPGNERKGGHKNPDYRDVFVFDNDFPALLPDSKPPAAGPSSGSEPPFIKLAPEGGICRVICFSPRHDLTLAEMEHGTLRKIIDAWDEQYQDLMSRSSIRHVMTFENKGEVMGCSNPHPHGQIWASDFLPSIPAAACSEQTDYFEAHASPLLSDYTSWELSQKERVICENDHWLAVVPFWAEWPFESMVLPKRTVRAIKELSGEERDGWASLLKELLVRYDNLFETSFPYSMGIYQAPKGDEKSEALSLYQVFLPPLLRSATVKKFMVGFELAAEVQRDITAETAAGRLRECSIEHYKKWA